MQAFKEEFTKVLEERERYREINDKLQNEIEGMTEEIISEKRDHMQFYERLRMMLSVHSTSTDLLNHLSQVLDELRVRRDESHSYKSQIHSLLQQLEHERSLMQSKLSALQE